MVAFAQARYRRVMGPNFFIWIAIGLVVITTIPAFYGHYWIAAVGWVAAIALAIFNKVRAIRGRGPDFVRTKGMSLLPFVGLLTGVAAFNALVGLYIIAGVAAVGAVALLLLHVMKRRIKP